MFRRLYNKKISGVGLSLFRIAYSLVLLGEVFQIYYFRNLIFDKIPYIELSEINFAIPIVIWVVSIVFILFGCFTRLSTIINYILSLILIGSITTYEYHMFYVYMGINFLLLFLPISVNLSIDRLLLKYKYSNTRFNYNPPTNVSVLSYYIPILIGVAFVYFDSIFFKLSSEFWKNGLGMWLPTSVPSLIKNDIQHLLNQEYLMYFLGYLTIVFEAIFIFTFFRKAWRIPLVIIGVGLHIGILICYPIPFFALGMCSFYLLLIPVSFWGFLSNKMKLQQPKIQFFYDAECPLCNRTKITIQYFDFQNAVEFKTVQMDSQNDLYLKDLAYDDLLNNIYSVKKGKVYHGIDTYIHVFSSIIYLKPISWILRIQGVYHLAKLVYSSVAKNRNTERCTEDNCGYIPPTLPIDEDKIKISQFYTVKDLKINLLSTGLFVIVLLQIMISYNSGINRNLRSYLSIENNKVNKFIENKSSDIESITIVLFGITHHAVFMDYHFSEYNHIIAITHIDNNGKETWLPIINKDGTPGNYLHGFNWVKWSFRVNDNQIDQTNLAKGIRDFTAFWAKKNNIDLNNATFNIKVKKIETPKIWEKDFLKRQMSQIWQNVGTAVWKDAEYFIEIPTIENL